MYFRFEDDFVEPKIKCIPMIVRFKLDACGIKLSLSEWSQMTPAERKSLVLADCGSLREVNQYRDDLRQLIFKRTGSFPAEFAVEETPAWSMTDEIPDSVKRKVAEGPWSFSIQQWKQLNDLQRFVLVKLSRPGHENKNFPKALAEFGLVREGQISGI